MFIYKKEIHRHCYTKPFCPHTMYLMSTAILNRPMSWNVIEFQGKKIALTICEDLWNLSDNPIYRVCPMEQLIRQKPDLMINISASPSITIMTTIGKEVLTGKC